MDDYKYWVIGFFLLLFIFLAEHCRSFSEGGF